jgi:hypothetical protein
MSIVFSMLPYSCPVFNMCWAYVDESVLYFIARMCSLNLVSKDLPVCPIYCRGSSSTSFYIFHHSRIYQFLLSYVRGVSVMCCWVYKLFLVLCL